MLDPGGLREGPPATSSSPAAPHSQPAIVCSRGSWTRADRVGPSRSCRRVPACAGARDHPETLEHRGKGAAPNARSSSATPSACVPDRIVVGSQWRGARHAPGHEHQPRFDVHRPREHSACSSRLETMVLMAQHGPPLRAIREQDGFGRRPPSSTRTASRMGRERSSKHVTEVQGMEGEVIVMRGCSVFEQTGARRGGQDPRQSRPVSALANEPAVHLPPNVFGSPF